jgi:1-deoxy-D-xylulose-5-phosphate reductoisomerase
MMTLSLARHKQQQVVAACDSPSAAPDRPFRLAVIGSTGSIGRQTLEVVAAHPAWFQVTALAAGGNLPVLQEQVAAFSPRAVCVRDCETRSVLQAGDSLDVLCGDVGLSQLVERDDVDWVVIGLVGMRALRVTLAALKAGKMVLTANKETFVAGGHLVAPWRASLVPIDSEHSAIFQCLSGTARPVAEVSALWLTASGGALREWPIEKLPQAKAADALKHPNWSMGVKVTIDSASLMNKALEVIEAHWLFGLPYERIRVAIHPQSVIHSAVSFQDGALLAQMGAPDMRQPIQYALSCPYRLDAQAYHVAPYSPLDVAQLTFLPPDTQRYPLLALAYEVGAQGGTLPTVFNAADEWLVPQFVEGRLSWGDLSPWVHRSVEAYMASGLWESTPTLEAVEAAQAWTERWLTSHVEPFS